MEDSNETAPDTEGLDFQNQTTADPINSNRKPEEVSSSFWLNYRKTIYWVSGLFAAVIIASFLYTLANDHSRDPVSQDYGNTQEQSTPSATLDSAPETEEQKASSNSENNNSTISESSQTTIGTEEQEVPIVPPALPSI